MRCLFGFLCVCAIGLISTVGCGPETGVMLCQGVMCDDDGDECTNDVCNPADGTCGVPVEDGTACDESNECTAGVCASGVCDSTPVLDGTTCDESNECTVGVCASGVCDSTPVLDGTTCGDGAGTCCSGACIPEILPVLDGANGIQASVFQASCASIGCHGSSVTPQAGLELSSASVSEANLINVDSTQVDKLRLAPGDPDASYLLDKLLGRNLAPGTLQQPPVGGPLCDPMIQAVEEWIAAGAN